MRAAAGMLAVAPLGVLAAALVAAPAVAAERDRGGELTVTVESVSFDASRMSGGGGWLGYVVTAPDGSHARNLGDGYSSDDAADGVLELDVPTRGPYADGYCITWAMVTGINDQFAGWDGDGAVCTTTAVAPSPTTPPAPAPTSPPATTDAAPAADVPAPPSTEQPARTAAVEPPAEEPDPSPEPTEGPTTEAPVEPTPTAEPTTVSPEPSRTPLVSAAERMAPPPPAAPGFPTLAVVGVGGLVAAAAGGAILLVRRVG